MATRGVIRDTRGTSMPEYVLVAALVAVASLGAWEAVGEAVDRQARCAAEAIASATGAPCGTRAGPSSPAQDAWHSVGATGARHDALAAEGDVTRSVLADGTIVRTESREGHWARFEYDRDRDGDFDAATTLRFSDDGRETFVEEDNDADGTVDATHRTILSDDTYRVERDDDADGHVDRVETRVLYGQPDATRTVLLGGRVIKTESDDRSWARFEYDNDVDGDIDSVTVMRFSADGNETFVSQDADADGVVDSTYRIVYSNEGTRVEYDDDADGTIDRRETSVTDTPSRTTRTVLLGGRVIKTESDDRHWARLEYDRDRDGVIDSATTLHYSADGRETFVENDDDADGVVDSTHRIVYPDPTPKIEFDDDADGDVDRTG